MKWKISAIIFVSCAGLLAGPALSQSDTLIDFEGVGAEEGITEQFTTDFQFEGSSWSGGVVDTEGDTRLYSSGAFSYEVVSGPAMVVFNPPIDVANFFYVHDTPGFPAGTATAFAADGTDLGSVSSLAATFFDDPLNFVTLDPFDPIASIEFSAGLIDDFGFTTLPAQAQVIATGFTEPLLVTAPPGETGRIFVAEKGGLIKIIKNGSVLGTPYLNVSGLISTVGERGLLGLAFHPDFQSNGFFFVHYSDGSGPNPGDTIIERYHADPAADVADGGSGIIYFTADQPDQFSNHNGGMISFRPGEAGNFLYLALGDGGGGNDGEGNGQDNTTVLGAIVRLDVDAGPNTAAASNPFFGATPGNDFVWVWGLRNPWRFSFDRDTGDMYIGDVGQGALEEVSFVAAASPGGENFGWPVFEGNDCNTGAGFMQQDCDNLQASVEFPIHEFGRVAGRTITGGYVYRGSAIPEIQGRYFLTDSATGLVRSFLFDGNNVTDIRDHQGSMIREGTAIVSFGEDGAGELYMADIVSGEIYKIVSTNAEVDLMTATGPGPKEVGDTAVFSVSNISGLTGSLTFQWQKGLAQSGVALVEGGRITGSDTQTLTITDLQLSDSGFYQLVVFDESKGGPFFGPPLQLQVFGLNSLPLGGLFGLGILSGLCMVSGSIALRRHRR